MSEKNRRSNFFKQSGIRGMAMWVVLLLFLVKIIYMSYQTGMHGMSFYAYADVVFAAGYILLGVAVLPVLKKLVYFQINHGNYKNASKVYHVICAGVMALTIFLSVVLFFCSTKLSTLLFGTKLCSLLLKIIAVALVCWIIMFCLKGYMEGNGNAMPGIVADVLAHLTGLVVTVLSQPAFAQYGRKVAALVRQDSYAYAYAVCSGALGLAVGGLFGLLFLLMIRSYFGKEIRRRIRSDEARKTDSWQDILWNFCSNYVKTAFVEHIGVLLAIVLFVIYSHMRGIAVNGAGMLYAGMVVLVLPVALLAWQISVPFTRQLTSIMKQSDYHHAKERMSFNLKLLSYTILPYATVGFALSPLWAELFFDVENSEMAAMIRIGMVGAVLVVYGIFFRQVLSVVAKPYVRNLCAGLLGLSGIGFWFLLKWSSMAGEICAAYAYVLACLLYLLTACFFVLKKIRIYNRLIDSVVLPFAASLLTAALAFGLFVLLETKLIPVLLMVLCLGVSYIVYQLVCAFLHLFEAHEWIEVPLSGVPVSLAKLIGKY